MGAGAGWDKKEGAAWKVQSRPQPPAAGRRRLGLAQVTRTPPACTHHARVVLQGHGHVGQVDHRAGGGQVHGLQGRGSERRASRQGGEEVQGRLRDRGGHSYGRSAGGCPPTAGPSPTSSNFPPAACAAIPAAQCQPKVRLYRGRHRSRRCTRQAGRGRGRGWGRRRLGAQSRCSGSAQTG